MGKFNKIALVGNQNSGKTTMFNLLTGSNQKVGNWPGVTIERKEGTIIGTDLTIVDLPGIYSMSPYTFEEDVSRKYVLEEKPDLIINIVDATCLERSMYLTTQLLELDTKVVIVLNMCDILEKKGLQIDEKKLSESLHTTVCKVSALKDIGIKELIDLIVRDDILPNSHLNIFSSVVENLINKHLVESSQSRFITAKLVERDEKFSELMNDELEQDILKVEEEYGYSIDQIIANERYEFINKIKSNSVIQKEMPESISQKIDKVFLNKFLAIPIFIVIMGLVYILSVGVVGGFTVTLIDNLFSSLKDIVNNGLTNAGASPWVISLLCDGIISGVGSVLNFVPQLIILFICISILETSGYMSRIAFFFDKIFHKLGLSGKSLIPFIVGSGCSVPGIMTARAVDDEDEKNITIMCTPFVPCSAKLPVITLFVGSFFQANRGLITLSLYLLSIIIVITSSFALRKLVFKQEHGTFISELPEYKLPSFKYVARDVMDKTWAFIKRAGTIILLFSVIVWFMCSFGWRFWEGMVDINDSMLASIGKGFDWFFYPIIGERNWGATVSAIQGLVAREQVVSTMNILAGLDNAVLDATELFQSSLFCNFNQASAYAFTSFILFSAPCIGTITAMKKELGSLRKLLFALAYQTSIAYIVAVILRLIILIFI